MTIAGILLAAGASRRFGGQDKLLAPFEGRALVSHAADALRALAPDHLLAVVRRPDVAAQLDGFTIVTPTQADPAQADSLRAGLMAAQAEGATRFLIVLGDMPHVTAGLLRSVAALCTETMPSAASDGIRPMPPACFPRASLPALLELRGDRGAVSLLKGLPSTALAQAPKASLVDIDVPEQLSADMRS